MRVPTSGPVAVGAVAVGLAGGVLLNSFSPWPIRTNAPENLPTGIAFVVLVNPDLPDSAVFARSGGGPDSARYTYTFRRADDAAAVVLAARHLFASEYRRVLVDAEGAGAAELR